MRWTRAITGVWLCFSGAAAQEIDPLKAARQPLSSEWLLLARIKRKAAANLDGLPNYTCIQTIERQRRNVRARRFEPLDTLRLEVALVAGKEMFSWPGERKFEERGIGEMAGGGGAIGNGNFALHARSIFLTRSAVFTYQGEETLNGRRAVRYNYRVPQMLSSYQIRTGSNQAFVGYHGSFWVDAGTLELIRLEVHAESIPPNLNLREAGDEMEYHRERIGQADFLLPQSSELTMIDLSGNISRNRTRFDSCSQYTGESTLSFGDPPPDVAPAAPSRNPIRLPPGLRVEVRLETPIKSGASAIGDALKAVVSRDVKQNGELVAPKGAVLTGRIIRLERREGPQDYYLVGLDFSTIEFAAGSGEFRAALQDAGLPEPGRRGAGGTRDGGRWQSLAIEPPSAEEKTGGVFVVLGSHVNLGRGHSMIWRTEE